jgi:membrane-associated phospholipid phosphatase
MEWVLAIRSDLLTPVFKAFTALGYSGFLFIFVPLGYWIIDKDIFARTGLWLLLSLMLNAYLKLLFQDPRPDPIFQLDPLVGKSYGFPSGHAQIAMVIWFWLAWETRKKWIWISSTFLVVCISFSRLYLGVHDLGDVLGGLLIGLLSLVIFILLTTKKFKWWHDRHPLWQLIALMIIVASFFFTWPGRIPIGVVGLGFLVIGFWSGVIIERKRIFFKKHRDLWRNIASGIIGVIMFMGLRKGFQEMAGILYDGMTTVVIIQALVGGVFTAALAPWIFQHLRLAEKGTLIISN